MFWMIAMTGTFGLAMIWLMQYWRGRVELTEAFRTALPVVVCLGAVLLWMIAQTYLPSPSKSWDVHATYFQAMKSGMYLSIFCLCLLIVQTRVQLEALAWVIVIGGVVQVLIKIFWDSSGTFVNRNHFAGYLEMALALGIGLMLARLNPSEPASWRVVARRWIRTLLGPKVIIRVLIVILVIGLILSRSRMGNTAFFGALFFAGIIGLLAFRRYNKSVAIFFVSILIVDVVLMGAFFGIDKLQQRFEQLDIAGDGRVQLSEGALAIAQDHWLTGTGAGSFYTTYPSYRDHTIRYYYDHAHNDLLQFPAELGVPASMLLAACLLFSLVIAIRVQVQRRSLLMKSMGFASTMGIISILIHSSADFNLQLTANAGTFMVLLAIPFLAWSIDRHRHGHAHRRSRL